MPELIHSMAFLLTISFSLCKVGGLRLADMCFPLSLMIVKMICTIFLYCKAFVPKLPYRFLAGMIARFMLKNFLLRQKRIN